MPGCRAVAPGGGRFHGRRVLRVQAVTRTAPAEISVRLGCTERTVYRVLERVKQWLEAMRSETA